MHRGLGLKSHWVRIDVVSKHEHNESVAESDNQCHRYERERYSNAEEILYFQVWLAMVVQNQQRIDVWKR